ncbi:hypothetical protein JL722_7507 [Aureococcus anophagefferens]|nr:hypothetical protein JL722_7507 [Aureococcus anophagefferens]
MEFTNGAGPIDMIDAATPGTPRSPAAKRVKTGQTPPRGAGTPPRTPRTDRTPRSPGSHVRTPSSDRFIPNRGSMDFDEANHSLTRIDTPKGRRPRPPPFPPDPAATPRLAQATRAPGTRGPWRSSSAGPCGPRCCAVDAAPSIDSGEVARRVVGEREDLPLRQREPARARRLRALPQRPRGHRGPEPRRRLATRPRPRPVPTKPSRILDAPDIVDDYYLNLLSWSSTNVLAVALANNVYLWNAATNEVSELLQLEQGDCVTSVSWAPGGSHLCVGTDSAAVQLWDTSRMVLVRSMRGHTARVGSLAWNPVSRCVNSGSRDALVLQHDARAARHRTATLVGHQQEVCGLSWSADGSTLASGGNENFLCLWDAARGGGTADRTIKFWNAHTGAMLHSVDTGSQVCALLWSRHHKEIVSSHGFSQNQLCLWRYPSMTKLCELTGHTARVLHLAQSPDGETVVSAAADETLRFWSIFGGSPNSGARKGGRGAMRELHLSSVGDGLSIR